MMVLEKLQCVDAAAVCSGPFGGMGGSWGGGKQKKRGKSYGWEFPARAESVAHSAGEQSSEFQPKVSDH